LMAGCFGLLAAFTLTRTGSLWFAIGMHSAWDWGESFLYSVPDSGLVVRGHLLNSSFDGPAWLTGGAVGPEASIFSFVALFAAAVGVHFLFPKTQNSKPPPAESAPDSSGRMIVRGPQLLALTTHLLWVRLTNRKSAR
jgi:hypothetical protein